MRHNKKKGQCSVKRSRRRTINVDGRYSFRTDLISTVDTVPSSLLTKQEKNSPVIYPWMIKKIPTNQVRVSYYRKYQIPFSNIHFTLIIR
jgi:hypothetical protein